MMGVSQEEAKRLSYWEYQALLWNWNERHRTGDEDDDIEAPSAEFVEHRRILLEERGIGKALH
jgi:hypothetical protein